VIIAIVGGSIASCFVVGKIVFAVHEPIAGTR
jgi:hypothetical protein